jgi:hypothetical protein
MLVMASKDREETREKEFKDQESGIKSQDSGFKVQGYRDKSYFANLVT